MGEFDYLNEYYGYLGANDLTTTQYTDLLKAQNNATVQGQNNWLKAIDYVLKYGGQALEILSKTGVIQNKNVAALNSINSQNLASLLAANGGQLGVSPENLNVDRSANTILGMNTSTVILIGFAVLAYLIYTKK